MSAFVPVPMLVPVLAAALLAGCQDAGTQQTKARLVGTWTSESSSQAGVTRRTLSLQADGRVKDTVHITAPTGVSATEIREGEWFFDGVNLKRKYTYIDGKPLTNAHFIYETQELKSITDSELVASSNVGRGTLKLERETTGGHP